MTDELLPLLWTMQCLRYHVLTYSFQRGRDVLCTYRTWMVWMEAGSQRQFDAKVCTEIVFSSSEARGLELLDDVKRHNFVPSLDTCLITTQQQ